MDSRFLYSIAIAVIAAAAAATSVHVAAAASQTQASSVAMKTPWGDPDLQGIWTEEFDTPFQRPAKYANQEFFYRGATDGAGQQAIGAARPARDRAAISSRLQPGGLHIRQAHRGAYLAGCRSAEWTDSAADRSGPEGGRCRSGFSPRPVAGDQGMQDEGGTVQWREI
jgi:hypothetical protein